MGYARPLDLETSAPIARADTACAATDKLLGLELLRFMSALAVLFFHYAHFAQVSGMPPVARAAQPLYALLWPLYDYGQYGVQIFWGIAATSSSGSMAKRSIAVQYQPAAFSGCAYRASIRSIL